MSIMRALGMFALACTGIGAIYMLAKTRWIKPNSVGIVLNYNTQQYEELKPGPHCLLSPFRWYVSEVSQQIQVNRLGAFSVKSLDNVDATVQADFTYTIEDPLSLYQKVQDPVSTFQETVKSALSAVIQTLNFPKITAAEINELAREGGHNEDGHHKSESAGLTLVDNSSAANEDTNSILAEDNKNNAEIVIKGANFFRSLLKRCEEWGIKIHNFRIISIEAKHIKVSQALELTAEADVRARAQLKAAQSQAATIRTLAAAYKDAQIIRAQGASLAAAALENENAMHVYSQENNVRSAQALGGKSNVLLNMSDTGGVSLGQNSFTAFAGRDNSQQQDNINESFVQLQQHNNV